ncbi:hypothetical protein Bca4012_098043 [Brassica carinata]
MKISVYTTIILLGNEDLLHVQILNYSCKSRQVLLHLFFKSCVAYIKVVASLF